MTSRQIFNQTVTLMFGDASDREDYAPYWHDILNILLAETNGLNNALRIEAGKSSRSGIPYICSFDEEVDCEPLLARAVLPLGGAAYMFLEDEPQIASYYMNIYQNMKSTAGAAAYVISFK